MQNETRPLSGPVDTRFAASLGGRLSASIGAIAGLGSVAASSCCVLPLALAGLGGGAGAFAFLSALAPMRDVLIAAAMISVAAGWALVWRVRAPVCTSVADCVPPRRRIGTIVILSIATAALALATVWPMLEPGLLRYMQSA